MECNAGVLARHQKLLRKQMKFFVARQEGIGNSSPGEKGKALGWPSLYALQTLRDTVLQLIYHLRPSLEWDPIPGWSNHGVNHVQVD